MFESFSIDFFKTCFKTPIIQINYSNSYQHFTIFNLATTFGSMSLVLEILCSSKISFYQQRNNYLQFNDFEDIFPLIYQQILTQVNNNSNQYICLTLMQQLQIFNGSKIKADFQIENIVCCILNTEDNTSFRFCNESYLMKNLMKSKRAQQLFMNFINLRQKQQSYIQQKLVDIFIQNFLTLKEQIVKQNGDIQQIILIKQKIYKNNRITIKQAKSWFQVAIYLNFIPKIIVNVAYPNTKIKQKQLMINKINGNPQITYNKKIYKNLVFIEGKCINFLIQISLEELRKSFFSENTLYVIQKQVNHAIARKCGPNGIHSSRISEHDWKILLQQQQIYQLKNWLPKLPPNIASETLFIKPNINKIECINFFITYFNYIKPIMNELMFIKNSNTLRINLTTQKYPNLIIDIIFHSKYIIKDSEVSMIIQKSNMKSCKLILNQMEITDSLMLFLANSQKMLKISELQIINCPKITENGINSLLISPYCKNLQNLNLSYLTLSQTSIQSITKKISKISQLTINRCFDLMTSANFSNLKLQYLQAFGLITDINFSQTLRFLRLDCEVSIDCLKQLIKLPLVELKLRLIEGKKNIMNAFGNFYLKDSNPARIFAEGNCQKTLKKVDFSQSSIKFKLLKPIFAIQCLETLILDNCEKIGHDLDAISPQIIDLSLKNTSVTMNQLNILISKNIHFITLNLANTLIKKSQIWQFLTSNKKSLNVLCVNEHQYSNKYLDNEKSSLTCIKVYLQKFTNHDNDTFFNHMLNKICQTIKTVYLLCQKKLQKYLIEKVRKYLTNHHLPPPKNIFVNEIGYYEIFNRTINKSRQIQSIKSEGTTLEIWQQHQPIDSFTYYLNKTLKQHSNKYLDINIQSNKVLGSDCIKMVKQYGEKRVKSIDFRNCLFKFCQVANLLIDFPYLTEVNDGEYQLLMEGDNFVSQSQRYLKFFMRVQKIKSLKVEVQKIQQVEILYSVLFHIIDHHSQSIHELQLTFKNIKNHQQSLNFWKRVCSLRKLNSLSIKLQPYFKDPNIIEIFTNINTISLKKLYLCIPCQFIPVLQIKDLSELYLELSEQFQDYKVSQFQIYCWVRHQKVQHQQNNQQQFVIIVIKQQIQISLTVQLILSFEQQQLRLQSCPLKQSSIFQFIESIKQLKLLKKFQINLSFTFENWNELLKSVENLKEQLKSIFIRIIAVNQTSKDFIFNRQQFTLQGVDFIM